MLRETYEETAELGREGGREARESYDADRASEVDGWTETMRMMVQVLHVSSHSIPSHPIQFHGIASPPSMIDGLPS